MSTQSIVLIISWTLFCMTSAGIFLSYMELEDLEVACPPRDSCRNRTTNDTETEQLTYYLNDTEIKYTCECERPCAERGTCCIDSPYINSDSSPARQQCIQSAETPWCGIAPHIWTVTRCKPGWNKSSTFKKLCEGDARRLNNFLMLVPAENSISGVVYRNYYCAVCNNDQKDVLLWDVKLNFTRPHDIDNQKGIFPQDIKYEENLGWGYWHSFNPGEPVFRSGSVKIHPHSSQKKKECRSDIIRSCVPPGKYVGLQKKCESYMAVLRGPMELIDGEYVRRIFKNIHCAVCNGVYDLEDVTCEQYYEDEIGIANGIDANCTEPVDEYPYSTRTEGGSIIPVLFGRNIGTQSCHEEGEIFNKAAEICIRDVR